MGDDSKGLVGRHLLPTLQPCCMLLLLPLSLLPLLQMRGAPILFSLLFSRRRFSGQDLASLQAGAILKPRAGHVQGHVGSTRWRLHSLWLSSRCRAVGACSFWGTAEAGVVGRPRGNPSLLYRPFATLPTDVPRCCVHM